MTYKVFISTLSIVLLFGMVSGCKKSSLKTEYLKGTLTWNGEVLAGATVTLHPKSADGVPASGISDDKGEFELFAVGGEPGAGAVAGDYAVTVSKQSNESKQVPDPNSSGGVRIIGMSKLLTPKIYENKDKTPLKITVISGKNPPFNLNLEGK